MEAEGARRKLTTILCADVAGYSRLMEADEEATLKTLIGYRKIIDGLVAGQRGRVFGSAGDSVVAEFQSAVEAVRCAVLIQDELQKRNADLAADRHMRFRIGINVGDVLIEGDDLLGDGVNIAPRLEALAEPGGISISGTVFDQIESKLDLGYEDLGEQEVKNIAKPVRVYRVLGQDGAAAADPPAAKLKLPDKPSIAVLPFDNMSGDQEQEYFSDGMAEDIITDLSKISGLFGIARNSAFAYKGKTTNVQQVAAELGVRYVLEGSVRKAGQRVRINAQLIDGMSGGHLWAERYDRDLEDIFAVQDEVTHEIVSALALKLSADEEARLAAKGTDNLEAYDYFLRGHEQTRRQSKEANSQARVLLERAVELDSGFAQAFAYLAHSFVEDYINRWSESPDQSLERAHDHARRALELDDSEPYAHFSLGLASLWLKRHDGAVAEAARSVAVDPNFAEGYLLLGHILNYVGRWDEAIEAIRTSMRLDPHHPNIALHFLAQGHFHLGQYEAAAANLNRRLIRKPDSDISRVLLAATYGHLGRAEAARAEWEEVFRVNPDYSLERRRQILPYKDPGDFERVVEGLRMAGLET
ncbi:MAG: adenylate/guanylate cyclase domain-containing protein [Alphaproteobacteria bacterium]|nr:adenylate/guanylate cyclase domain-containing protein [Alphaproteobacteria bacterium]